MSFVIKYRHLAWYLLLAFLGTFGLGGLLTFTVTEYSANTDVIFRFFKTSNPCIFFDHYPANLASSFGVALWMYGAGAIGLVTLFHGLLMQTSPWCHPGALVIATVIQTIAAMCLINLFPDDLYHDHGYLSKPPTKAEYDNVTWGNMTPNEKRGVSPALFHAVANHTRWLVIALAADIFCKPLLRSDM